MKDSWEEPHYDQKEDEEAEDGVFSEGPEEESYEGEEEQESPSQEPFSTSKAFAPVTTFTPTEREPYPVG